MNSRGNWQSCTVAPLDGLAKGWNKKFHEILSEHKRSKSELCLTLCRNGCSVTAVPWTKLLWTSYAQKIWNHCSHPLSFPQISFPVYSLYELNCDKKMKLRLQASIIKNHNLCISSFVTVMLVKHTTEYPVRMHLMNWRELSPRQGLKIPNIIKSFSN